EAAEAGAGGLVGPKRAGLQKRDRNGDSAHFLLRQFRVEVDRIGVFDRAGELAHLAPIDVHLEWFAGFPDGALVGHINQPLSAGSWELFTVARSVCPLTRKVACLRRRR